MLKPPTARCKDTTDRRHAGQLRRPDPPETAEATGDLVVEDRKGDAGQRQRKKRVAAGKGDQFGKRHGDDRVMRGVDCTRAALNRPATDRACR